MTNLCGDWGQVFLGQGLHQLDELLPANSLPLDDIFAAGLLIFFGVKTLLVRSPFLKSCKSCHRAEVALPPAALSKYWQGAACQCLCRCGAGCERG